MTITSDIRSYFLMDQRVIKGNTTGMHLEYVSRKLKTFGTYIGSFMNCRDNIPIVYYNNCTVKISKIISHYFFCVDILEVLLKKFPENDEPRFVLEINQKKTGSEVVSFLKNFAERLKDRVQKQKNLQREQKDCVFQLIGRCIEL